MLRPTLARASWCSSMRHIGFRPPKSAECFTRHERGCWRSIRPCALWD
jgi:hypothetical protein